MTHKLVIFGASGDLTSRKLIPSLVQLHETGRLPEGLTVLGIARDDWDRETFRSHIRKKLEQKGADLNQKSRDAVLSLLDYRQADVTHRQEVSEALGKLEGPIVAYLALPPRVFAPTIEALAGLGLPEESRVVVEKPFGENLEDARKLNRLLHEGFPERSVFRIDHFLGMQTVQNILGARFANRLFGDLWNRDEVEWVEIVWDETLTLEGRAGYYDRAGALKDMTQNHLLQLLCLVGMEAPLTMSEGDLRDRKLDLLRAVRRLSPDEVKRRTVRARYGKGKIGDRAVPAYVEEKGIDPERGTETFAQVVLDIDNWRWAGVPFVLRTGKALARSRQEIAIHFRPVPHLAFAAENPPANVLRFQLNPDRMALGININGIGDPFSLEYVELDADFAPQDVPAYGRLLLNFLEADCTLSIRDDEAEEAWRIMEPIVDVWQAGDVPLLEYPAGSDGPKEAASGMSFA